MVAARGGNARRGVLDRCPRTGPEWLEAYYAANADYIAGREPHRPSLVGAERVRPGTLAAGFVGYIGSASFKNGLAETSQRVHFNILSRLRDQWGDRQLKDLLPRHIVGWVDERAGTPAAAQVFLKVLRRYLRYCASIGLIDHDPAAGVKTSPLKSSGIYCWADAEIEQYRRQHRLGSSARLAMELLLGTAQRRSDVVRMGRQHVRGDMLRVVQQKTGWEGDIPIGPELAAALAAVPAGNLTFLTTAWGAPFSAAGFGNKFCEWCNEAGLDRRCSSHGLRKAACRQLAESGCSVHEIAAISGHLTLAEVQRYTKAVDQAQLARAARAKTGTQIGERRNLLSKIDL